MDEIKLFISLSLNWGFQVEGRKGTHSNEEVSITGR